MTPDPKWLEILKASGWQTAAFAAAFGVILLVIHMGWLVPPSAWFTLLCLLAFLICIFLTLATMGRAVAEFFQPRVWFVHWARKKQQRQMIRKYIPFMTEQERGIVAYLLAKNQKIITAEQDGDYAVTLISRGILVRSQQPGQFVDPRDVPFEVPDPIWNELMLKRENFPYVQVRGREQNDVEPHPWRVPWMAR